MFDDYMAVIGVIGTVLSLLFATVGFVRKYWSSQEVASNPLTYYVLLINLAVTTSLPLSLLFEFGLQSEDPVHKTFQFYCRQYPHMVVFPALLFQFAGLFAFQAAKLRWIASRRAVIVRMAIAALGAFFVMYYEATGGYMMLFEFNKDAQAGTRQFQSEVVRQKTKALGIDAAFDTPMAHQVVAALSRADGKSPIARVLENYDAWDRLDESWRSNSRAVYLVVFWYMLFVMFLSFSLLPSVRHSRSRLVESMTSLNLAGTLFIFLMWMPFRIYYNHHTKIPIFGPGLADNFLGDIPSFDLGGITASEAAPMVVIVVFLFFLLLRAADISRRLSIMVVSALGACMILGSTFLAVLRPATFDAIYGLNGDLKHLAFRIVVFFLLLLLTYDFIASRVDSVPKHAPDAPEP